jgi:hypothetical protein
MEQAERARRRASAHAAWGAGLERWAKALTRRDQGFLPSHLGDVTEMRESLRAIASMAQEYSDIFADADLVSQTLMRLYAPADVSKESLLDAVWDEAVRADAAGSAILFEALLRLIAVADNQMPDRASAARYNLGVIERERGDDNAARREWEQSRRSGEPEIRADSLWNLAKLAEERGDRQQRDAYLREAANAGDTETSRQAAAQLKRLTATSSTRSRAPVRAQESAETRRARAIATNRRVTGDPRSPAQGYWGNPYGA